MLRGLGRTQGTTKTQIVLSALRSVFEENFLEKKSILLPEDQYQALVELVGSPLTPNGQMYLQNGRYISTDKIRRNTRIANFHWKRKPAA